jgi:hypothetical protein
MPTPVVIRDNEIAEALRPSPPEQIGDAVARDAEQPAGGMVDRHQQPVRFDQFGEDLLQDVLGIARVGHAPANEVPQARLLAADDTGDPIVLFSRHSHGVCRRLHLQL